MRLYSKVIIDYIDLDDPFYVQKINRQMISGICNARFNSGGGGESKQESKFTKEEKAFRSDFSTYMKNNFRNTATPYSGELFSEIDPQFFSQLGNAQTDRFRDVGDSAMNQQLSGDPTFTYNPEQITDLWQNSFATPAMNTWNEFVAPNIREGFAGGDIFNTRAGQHVGQQASQFFGSSVAPTLFAAQQTGQQMGFQAGETAAGRQANAINAVNPYVQSSLGTSLLPFQLEQGARNQKNTADFQEFLRMTQEESPWLKMALATYTGMQPSVDTIVGQQGGGAGGAMMGALGGAASGAAIGSVVPGIGTAVGAGIGGLMGAFGGYQ